MLDTSALIRLKSVLPVADQWPALVQMSALVSTGHLAYPRQVARELKEARYPDAPGVWAAGQSGSTWHPEPSDDHVAEAMGVAQLVDPSSELEEADPYVVAMALGIHEHYPSADVVVVTEDQVDRMPAKEALATAYVRLGLAECTTDAFVDWLRSGPA